MQKCPKCNHKYYEEKIIPFYNYDEWCTYITNKMPEAKRMRQGSKTVIQSNYKDGRVLAEWNGYDYGYVSEGRHNHLKRMTYHQNWGSV